MSTIQLPPRRHLPLPPIFDNQKRASKTIYTIFKDTGVNYVLLTADVQAGKTGCYMHLAKRMLRENHVDHVYILCGTNETELRKQCQEDARAWFGHLPYGNRVQVVFRQDLEKTAMKPSRILVINDESHLDCKKDQMLAAFLTRHGLHMGGTTPEMIQHHIYITSVSGTPFGEESAIAYGKSLPKACVRLSSGEMYFGPVDYYREGRIQPTFLLTSDENRARFLQIIETHSQGKYTLLRISEARHARSLTPLIAALHQRNIAVLRFTSKYEGNKKQIVITRKEADEHYVSYGIRIPNLEEAPATTTVVILEGRMRCGKRVPKKHIGCVWEQSHTQMTDVVIQGLLGRMSGYRGSGVYNVPMEASERPMIYVSPYVLKSHPSKVIEHSDLERYFIRNERLDRTGKFPIPAEMDEKYGEDILIGPLHATHLLPREIMRKERDRQHQRYPCVPVKFQLPWEVMDAMDSTNENAVKETCLDYLMTHIFPTIPQTQLLTPEQQREIMSKLICLGVEDCHLRRYQGTTNQNMHRRQVEAFDASEVSKEGIESCPFLTFCVTFTGFEPMQGVPYRTGEVFAIFYTEVSGYVNILPKETRVSMENGLTHFTFPDPPILAPVEVAAPASPLAAAGLFGFTSDIEDDPERLEEELLYFVEITRESNGRGIFSKVFTGMGPNHTIQLNKTAYGARLERLNEIIDRLYETYDVRVEFTIRLREKNENYHILSSIEWK